jgi:endoglucanase
MNILKGRFLIILILLTFVACDNDEENKNSLVINRNEFNFSNEGGTFSLILHTDAKEWHIQNPADWITLSLTSGTTSDATIKITVSQKSPVTRSESITIIAGTADPIEIKITQEASEYLYSMSSNFTSLSFLRKGNSAEIEMTTDAPNWNIIGDVSWLTFVPESGTKGTTKIKVTASQNAGIDKREGTIQIKADLTPTVSIKASQIGEYYPNYNISPLPEDPSGMSSTATVLASKIKLGINIGNTMEAIGGETNWGNPKITKSLVDSYKNHGFNAIRIPCSFNQNANPTSAKINDDWLNRVKQVVQYCIDNELYVVLNIHWDGGWLENNIAANKEEEVNARQKAFWEQIATHLRDYDEHLIFASANEPAVENAAQMTILSHYHQTFVDAVRSTGGRNSHRVLVIQGPSTDVEKTQNLFKSFPTDPAANKLMMELHYYTPYQFTLMSEDATWGKMFYYWGKDYHSTIDPTRNATWGEEADLDRLFSVINTQFVKKGYPVVLGEFGAYKRRNIADQALHDASVEYFNKYVVQSCLKNGILPFYWDTGGLINRNTGAVIDQGVLDALNQGAGN